MDTDVFQRLEELERKLAQMHVRGKVVEVDYERQRARVQYGKNQTTGWLRWKPFRAGQAIVWWPLEVGEAVTVLSPGDLTLGEILPSSYSEAYSAPSNDPDLFLIQFDNEAKLSYHRETKELTADLPEGGTTVLKSSGGVTIVGDTVFDGNVSIKKNTTIDGTTHSKGAVTCDADVSDETSTMQAMRNTYNEHDHNKAVSPPAKQMK